MIRTMIVTFLLGSSFALSACNTVEGAGRDMKSAGSAIENSAK
ncbi:MAG: entericidin A/B family lipoprotein [Sphingobium sp.]|nr:entericidin A/B family lipoprotein [Sphingobium sp.]